MQELPTALNKQRMIMGPPPHPTPPSTALVIRDRPTGPATPSSPINTAIRPSTPMVKQERGATPHTPTSQRPSTLPPTPSSRSPVRAKSLDPSPRRRRSSATPSPATSRISHSAAFKAKLAELSRRTRARSTTVTPSPRRRATTAALATSAPIRGTDEVSHVVSPTSSRYGNVETDEDVFWTGSGVAAGRSVEHAIEVDSPPSSPTPSRRGDHTSEESSALVPFRGARQASSTPGPELPFRRGSTELSTASLRSEYTPFIRASVFDTSDPRYGRRYNRGEASGRNIKDGQACSTLPLLPRIAPFAAELANALKQCAEVASLFEFKAVSPDGIVIIDDDNHEALVNFKYLIDRLFNDDDGHDGRIPLVDAVHSDLAGSNIHLPMDALDNLILFLRKAITQVLSAHHADYPTAVPSSSSGKTSLAFRQSDWYARHKTWAEFEITDVKNQIDQEMALEVLGSMIAIWSSERMKYISENLIRKFGNVTPSLIRKWIAVIGD
nr:uncharacterized protein CI109_002826 [Kwoniella shandongensis]KAA5528668.1 hypothetical protein CI109_002826 [Kwoniella shandongensis]